MYSSSAAMRRALDTSHRVISRCTVMRAGEPVTPDLTAISGELVDDPDAQIRCSGSITALDEHGELTPDLVKRIVDVYTCELQLSRGVRFADGTEEVVPTGRMSMSRLKVSQHQGGVTFSASLLDRSARCQGSRARAYVIPAGTYVEDAIPPLLATRYPPLTFSMFPTEFALATQILDAKKDAWTESKAYAESAGQQLFMGRQGECLMIPTLSVNGDVVWDYEDGRNCMVGIDRIISADDVPNVVVVYGTNPAAPGIRAEAFDANPQSATYRFGPYGERVLEVNEPRIASQAQAEAMAKAKLIEVLGPGETIEFDAAPNPLLDPYDTIRLTVPRLGLERAVYTLAQLRRPYRANGGLMHVVGRRAVFNADDPLPSVPVIGGTFSESAPPPPRFPDLTITDVSWAVEP